jgi:hypothetical protein
MKMSRQGKRISRTRMLCEPSSLKTSPPVAHGNLHRLPELGGAANPVSECHLTVAGEDLEGAVGRKAEDATVAARQCGAAPWRAPEH